MRVGLIRFLLRLSAAMPLRFSQALGTGVGRLILWLPNEMKKVARVNIDLCFADRPAVEHAALWRESLLETGRTAAGRSAVQAR